MKDAQGLKPLADLQFSVRQALVERVAEAQQFWSETFADAPFKAGLNAISKQQPSDKRLIFTANLNDVHIEEQLSRVETEYNINRKVLFESLWALVLQQHTGSDEVMFGAASHASSLLKDAHMADVYPLRVKTAPNSRFLDLVASIDSFHRKAYRHSFLEFSDIEHLLPDVLETMVYFAAKPLDAQDALPFLPLVLSISSDSGLHLSLLASSAVEPHAAESLLSHFVTALSSALSKLYLPHALAQTINLASHEEQLALALTNRSRKPEKVSTIVRLFEDTASKYPNKFAIENEQHEKLTFNELNSLANKLARTLNIEKGSIVPICLDRSIELVIALLAVLKAGAVYTVLDAEGPAERNAQIIEACDARLVIANEKYLGLFSSTVDIDQALILCRCPRAGIDGSNLGSRIDPEDRAYIIYTSGSTGRPKGVVLTHRAATNGMHYHSLNGRDRWLLFYNPTFSAAQRTILSTLVHGGTLIVALKSTLQNDLARVIKDCRVQSLGITPSALSTMKPSDVPSLEQITLVGESIQQSLVAEWASQVELRNTYGLSEVTQLNFGARLTAMSNARIVGRPADTTSAYILVPGSTELAPTGVAGELGLAGPQLGLGYLNAAEQTDKVFIDNPFDSGKLYRTGDSARLHHDGSIEILGRIDFQAKIAGQKVEPAEINAVLLRHQDVTGSITVAAEVAGRLALVAGLVIADGADWASLLTQIRKHAEQYLPSYMVPLFWICLTEVPTNINGKMDLLRFKKSVEAMSIEELLEPSLSIAGNTPITNPTELLIAQVWANVLGLSLDVVRREHSFTALGGSSIQAIRAVQDLRQIDLQTTLEEVLTDMTVEQAASAYVKLTGERSEDPTPFELVADPTVRQTLVNDPNIVDAYPATALQQEFLSSVGAVNDSCIYRRIWNVSKLDTDRLRQSFEIIFDKSDMLRTGFAAHGRSILQVINADMQMPWAQSDLDLQTFLTQDEAMPLSMNGPLFRVTLLSQTTLVVSMHHLLFDFWSFRFMYQDVALVYQGLEPPSRAPFRRYINHLSTLDEKVTRRFWKKKLSGAAPTKLNQHPTSSTVKVATNVPSSHLREKLKQTGLTLGAVLHAAWHILLHKRTGQSDVTSVTSLSGRDAPVLGIGTMDAPTLSMALQRTVFNSEDTLAEVAKTVGTNVRQSAAHSHYGLRNACSAAGLQQESFDTFLNILISPENDPHTEAVFGHHERTSQWDTTFTIMEAEEDGDDIAYRAYGRVEERLLEYILKSYIKIVETIIESPSQRVADLDVLDTGEKDYLYNTLSHRNTLRSPVPDLLHARFEGHAARTPDSIAIDWNGTENITYAELDHRANHLAHLLIASGTSVGDKIPLLLDKSIDTIVAILGVMKTGAAYVPLNPENPVERNLFIVQDVRAKTMIIHLAYSDFCAVHNMPAIIMEDLTFSTAHASPLLPITTSVTPNDLAYIIYTSGSSGMPKGVKVPHRSAAAAVTSMEKAEGRGSGEWRTLQFANYVFDASVQDIFNTLSTCGTLCMAPHDVILSDLVGTINRMNVHQAIVTPTVAKLLQPNDAPGLKTLIVGGEPLTSDVVNAWAPDREVLNVYGPTETSMVVSTKRVNVDGVISNIGAPFETVMAFIVDPNSLSLVPYGSVGELCIAGPQVTEGYVNRDDLTAAAFVDGKDLGVEKLYRTGDLARWLENGELSCLGRKDGQIKIHGHRIELGEIEVALTRTGLIEENAVIAMTVNGKPVLVAFCVFDADGSSAVQSLEHHIEDFRLLREALDVSGLTPYMMPSIVLPVGELPKLPSRKVDRKVLQRQAEQLDAAFIRQYTLARTESAHTYTAPETEQEAVLEQIWSKVLGIPVSDIGRKADFKSLGGDSVTAISLSSAVSRMNFTLSVNNILRQPRLDEMAMAMQARDVSGPVKLKREFIAPTEVQARVEQAGLEWDSDVDYVYPCPPGQVEFVSQGARDEQMWILMTVRRMPLGTDVEKWTAATTELIRVNDILRTTWLRVNSGDWLGVVLRSYTPELVIFDCASEAAKEELVEDFWAKPFAFGKPFIKFALLKHQDGSLDIAVKLNHAVYDGTLLRIFDDHFGAILADQQIPHHGQFKDFAFHIYQSDKTRSLEYWKQTMAGRSEAYLSTISTPKITAVHRTMIDTNLDSISSSTGVSPSAIFQAAYELWLSHTSGNSDVNFDYLLSGRNIDLPDPLTINGMLANFLPVRHVIDEGQTSIKTFLQATQDNFWAMTEHGNVGLHDIHAATGLDRKSFGNRTLFLFQPFEPAGAADESRWLILAKSRVRMYQPYALVVEVAKAPEGRHKLAVMYDETVFSSGRAEEIAEEIKGVVDTFAEAGGQERMLSEI